MFTVHRTGNIIARKKSKNMGGEMKKDSKFALALVVLAIVAAVALWLYALITYGGKPITEIPSWAIPFIIGGGRR